ncbi:Lrp/AsnC family transcriptional regulator [Leeia sp. TBRC 13508]|uniref:Lrp/AsnC family transcriptional regulator n=1 Tax=Leeia speluncae TaxID=2884804 RepID=A0ABS8D8K2_9NEIS|nr:Lrp/AsnC family transcriptional regulator [Leeia speluncae]MCB6184552.1 Lrp/AsnC family transcriptional regulator [Leeia speluncae]
MDALDRKILAELQKDGRLSVTDLAERVGLSLSPCHRRLRALETSGVITGYVPKINARAVGLQFSAIVFVSLRDTSGESVQAFENAVLDIEEVVRAERLFGDPDFMLHVVAKDLLAFQTLYDRQLSRLPSVLRLSSTLVMKSIIDNRPLPL